MNTKKDKITYEGYVQIKLVRGRKVIKTINTHNAGRLPLFSFISRCLAGTLDDMQTLYPRYIRLFHTNDITDVSSLFLNETTTTALPVSGISLDTTAQSEPQAQVKYEFVIPFSALSNDYGSSNVIAIYNTQKTLSNEKNEPSAYVTLTGSDVISSEDKLNVIITWTMVISNK